MRVINLLNDLANDIISKIDIVINELEIKLNELSKELDILDNFRTNTAGIINDYSKTQTIDLPVLNECLMYLRDKGKITDSIDYEKFYSIRNELSVDFPEKTKEIEKKFENLMQQLNSYVMKSIVDYQKIRKNMQLVNEKYDLYKKLKTIITKITNGQLVTDEEINLLDEIRYFYDKSYIELYALAVKNNYIRMNEVIFSEKNRIKHEMKSNVKSRVKTRRKKKDKPKETIEEVTIKEDLFDEELKQLYKRAKQIVSSHDISNKEFLALVDGLDALEMIDYISDFGDELDNIALILNDVILKAIDEKNYEDAKEIISLYLEEYERCRQIEEQIQTEQTIEDSYETIKRKLSKIKNGDTIFNNLSEIEEFIKEIEEDRDNNFYNMYGYIMELKQLISDIKDLILDDELLDSDLLYEYADDLANKYRNLQNQLNENNKEENNIDEEDTYEKQVSNFYDGACNLIVFLDNVDFSKQIDDDKRLKFEHKKRVLHGLEDLSKDEEILSSSRHKVKDYDVNRYRQLRSYKSPEYRIIYKVSRAEGLERI